jgi:hypothetical protein
VERFNRALATEWSYRHAYASNADRARAHERDGSQELAAVHQAADGAERDPLDAAILLRVGRRRDELGIAGQVNLVRRINHPGHGLNPISSFRSPGRQERPERWHPTLCRSRPTGPQPGACWNGADDHRGNPPADLLLPPCCLSGTAG